MVKAIQVLRIHLLELEKVSDLCKDFCSRYITCLKTKMNSETLLSGEPGSLYSPTHDQVDTYHTIFLRFTNKVQFGVLFSNKEKMSLVWNKIACTVKQAFDQTNSLELGV